VTEGGWQWRVAALDVSGNVLGTSKWRTFAVDATRPRVVKRSPVRTATRTANFVARFSEPVRNVSRTTMKLFVEGRKSPLMASVRISRDRRTATLNPSANLKPGKRYTLRLSSGIRDGAGLTLKATGWSARAK
jgi:hypothetical protein